MTSERIVKLTDEQRRVLKIVARNPYSTPRSCKTGIRTWLNLSKRKLIYIGTTFASISNPRVAAEAIITDAGRTALSKVK